MNEKNNSYTTGGGVSGLPFQRYKKDVIETF